MPCRFQMNELESSVEAAPKWTKLQFDQTDRKDSFLHASLVDFLRPWFIELPDPNALYA